MQDSLTLLFICHLLDSGFSVEDLSFTFSCFCDTYISHQLTHLILPHLTLSSHQLTFSTHILNSHSQLTLSTHTHQSSGEYLERLGRSNPQIHLRQVQRERGKKKNVPFHLVPNYTLAQKHRKTPMQSNQPPFPPPRPKKGEKKKREFRLH